MTPLSSPQRPTVFDIPFETGFPPKEPNERPNNPVSTEKPRDNPDIVDEKV